MMEIFGLINRDRLMLSVPYMAGYGQQLYPGLGGVGGFPGMSPYSGFGGAPGMSPFPGAGGWSGGGFPGAGGIPGGWSSPGYTMQGPPNRASGRLDGAWELENGSFVILRGDFARLYLSREHYQDFAVGYDRQYLWWKPIDGGAASRYLYQTREGRMILRDQEGKLLLLRRRR